MKKLGEEGNFGFFFQALSYKIYDTLFYALVKYLSMEIWSGIYSK